MVAVAQVLVASVLCLPGTLRRWTYAVQALAISALLAWLDRSGEFLGHAHFANLLAAAAVAYAMDGYMLKNARALFAEKCRVAQERQRADAVLYNTLPPLIAQELKSQRPVRAQSYPDMSILFADIAGFTAFAAQRTPDQVLDLLNRLFTELDALMDNHHVEKIKTMGDAYLVISKTNPQALARLALSMCEAMQSFNQRQGLQLALRLGLHCGPAIAGVIGHKCLMYDVWGDAVNLASRMQSSSLPGRIHASESMFHRLRDSFDFEARGLVDIKGKGLLPGYFLLGARKPGAAAPTATGPVA
jgi:class 3 adenylate cyclase